MTFPAAASDAMASVDAHRITTSPNPLPPDTTTTTTMPSMYDAVKKRPRRQAVIDLDNSADGHDSYGGTATTTPMKRSKAKRVSLSPNESIVNNNYHYNIDTTTSSARLGLMRILITDSQSITRKSQPKFIALEPGHNIGRLPTQLSPQPGVLTSMPSSSSSSSSTRTTRSTDLQLAKMLSKYPTHLEVYDYYNVISRTCLEVVVVSPRKIVLRRRQLDVPGCFHVPVCILRRNHNNNSHSVFLVTPNATVTLTAGDVLMIHNTRHLFRVVTAREDDRGVVDFHAHNVLRQKQSHRLTTKEVQHLQAAIAKPIIATAPMPRLRGKLSMPRTTTATTKPRTSTIATGMTVPGEIGFRWNESRGSSSGLSSSSSTSPTSSMTRSTTSASDTFSLPLGDTALHNASSFLASTLSTATTTKRKSSSLASTALENAMSSAASTTTSKRNPSLAASTKRQRQDLPPASSSPAKKGKTLQSTLSIAANQCRGITSKRWPVKGAGGLDQDSWWITIRNGIVSLAKDENYHGLVEIPPRDDWGFVRSVDSRYPNKVNAQFAMIRGQTKVFRYIGILTPPQAEVALKAATLYRSGDTGFMAKVTGASKLRIVARGTKLASIALEPNGESVLFKEATAGRPAASQGAGSQDGEDAPTEPKRSQAQDESRPAKKQKFNNNVSVSNVLHGPRARLSTVQAAPNFSTNKNNPIQRTGSNRKRKGPNISSDSWWTAVRKGMVKLVRDGNCDSDPEVPAEDQWGLQQYRKASDKTWLAFAKLTKDNNSARYIGFDYDSDGAKAMLKAAAMYRSGDLEFMTRLTGATKLRVVSNGEVLEKIPFDDFLDRLRSALDDENFEALEWFPDGKAFHVVAVDGVQEDLPAIVGMQSMKQFLDKLNRMGFARQGRYCSFQRDDFFRKEPEEPHLIGNDDPPARSAYTQTPPHFLKFLRLGLGNELITALQWMDDGESFRIASIDGLEEQLPSIFGIKSKARVTETFLETLRHIGFLQKDSTSLIFKREDFVRRGNSFNAPSTDTIGDDEESTIASPESGSALVPKGVTMRPSGMWQAQIYFGGKSRYIGVFPSSRMATLAYAIAKTELRQFKSKIVPYGTLEASKVFQDVISGDRFKVESLQLTIDTEDANNSSKRRLLDTQREVNVREKAIEKKEKAKKRNADMDRSAKRLKMAGENDNPRRASQQHLSQSRYQDDEHTKLLLEAPLHMFYCSIPLLDL